MTVVEGRQDQIQSDDSDPSSTPPPDVIAECINVEQLAVGDESIIFHAQYWRNPGNRTRISATKFELALTKMGEIHKGLDELVLTEWHTGTTERGILQARTVQFAYNERDLQLVQMQEFNCHGRLIEECFVVVVPDESRTDL